MKYKYREMHILSVFFNESNLPLRQGLKWAGLAQGSNSGSLVVRGFKHQPLLYHWASTILKYCHVVKAHNSKQLGLSYEMVAQTPIIYISKC